MKDESSIPLQPSVLILHPTTHVFQAIQSLRIGVSVVRRLRTRQPARLISSRSERESAAPPGPRRWAREKAGNVRARHAEALHLVRRNVDPSLARVFAHVTDDVRELECGAELLRVLEGARIAIAEDTGRKDADHAGDAVGVAPQ